MIDRDELAHAQSTYMATQLELPLIYPNGRKRGAKAGLKKTPWREGEPETKVCNTCKEQYPIEEFGKRTYRGRTGNYRRADCYSCERTRTRNWAAKDPERARKLARTQNERQRTKDGALYGAHKVTWVAVQEMIEAQEGRCAACEEEVEPASDGRSGWHLDHDHGCCPGKFSCGRCVRGMVCQQCNQGMGHFRDNPVKMRKAADYLEAYRAKGTP